MKKKLICILIMRNFFLWAETGNSADNFKLNFYTATGFQKIDNELSLDSAGAGGKISLLFYDVCYSKSIEKQNFGISVNTEKIFKKFPCNIKYGNLSTGGSWSKLKNPLLSASSSPFSTGSITANCVTASLPGFTSFSNPETVFTQFGYSDSTKLIRLFKINCIYNLQNQDAVFSSLLETKLPANLNIGFSTTAGICTFDENIFSSWFTTDDYYYHYGRYNFANFNLSLNHKKAGTLLSAYLYESPFGKINPLFKTENLLKTKHTTINFSSLYNPQDNLITSSQNNISRCLQLKTGIIYNLRCKTSFPLFIKTGISFYDNFQFSQAEHNLRLTAGIQLTSNPTLITVSACLNTKIYDFNQPVFDSSTLQITDLFYFQKFTTKIKIDLNINPAADFSYITFNQKYSLVFSLKKYLSISTCLSLSLKDLKLKKMSENSTIQLQFHKNYINYVYKLSLEWL